MDIFTIVNIDTDQYELNFFLFFLPNLQYCSGSVDAQNNIVKNKKIKITFRSKPSFRLRTYRCANFLYVLNVKCQDASNDYNMLSTDDTLHAQTHFALYITLNGDAKL